MKRWQMVLAGIGLLIVAYLGWIFIQVGNAGNDAQSRAVEGETIVVLGAAQYNGEPSPVLRRRLDTALALWNDGAAERIVTTGSNQPGDNFTEGFVGFRYLRNAGVAERNITVVVDGADTYESMLATANQLTAAERKVLIVTDAYHALRSEEIAREVGLDPTVVAAGSDLSMGRRLRETAAVALGRIITYRRLSSWVT